MMRGSSTSLHSRVFVMEHNKKETSRTCGLGVVLGSVQAFRLRGFQATSSLLFSRETSNRPSQSLSPTLPHLSYGAWKLDEILTL